MDVKKVALLVGALVIAVVTAIMAKNMFAGAGADRPMQRPWSRLARKSWSPARRCPLAPSSMPESLAFQAWPKELVQNAYYTEGAPEADMRS